MDGYNVVNLFDAIQIEGETEVKKQLGLYSCPLNMDVESFLKEKSILFTYQGLSQTYLIYMPYQQQPALVG
jgi:hypothetical protein